MFFYCPISSIVGLCGFRANYNDGFEVEREWRNQVTIGRFVIVAGSTWLSIKAYQYFQQMTIDSAYQISADIQTIYQEKPWLDPGYQLVLQHS